MKKVIVTGATGAVGTALVEELIHNGVEVLVFSRENSKRNHQIPHHPLVKKLDCSLEQLESVENITGQKYDVFYHLAWEGTSGVARDDQYLQNRNVKYALDAVGAAKRFGCNLFIGAGSQAEYGRVNVPLHSDTPTHPVTGYGIGKLCAGQMTRRYAKQMDIQHIWVRILSVYGSNDSSQSMIMSAMNQIRNDEIPSFTKSEQMWDYLFSSDAGRALRLIGEKGKSGKVYVLGSGVARPLIEYIEELRDAINPQAEIRVGAIPYSQEQVMFLKADISDLTQDVGFTPQVTFKQGIEAILAYHE